METQTTIVPPPWSLTGSGLILLYRFDPEFVATHTPPFLENRFAGGFGAMMLLDYHTSNAGPYQELLFVPGRFQWGNRQFFSVTKIYVSTQTSIDSGQHNWGIPKQHATFDFGQLDPHTKHVVVSTDEKPVLRCSYRPVHLRIPAHTGPLGSLPTLIQRRETDGMLLATRPLFRGQVNACRILNLQINPALFPDVQTPLIAFHLPHFHLTFPRASGIAA